MAAKWFERAVVYIDLLMRDVPPDATLPQRRKRLRENGYNFHGDTYWGRKQWGKAVRRYLERHGQAPRIPATAENAPNFGPDIIFPFRSVVND